MAKFYVTTSIAYVNGDPHIGYAIELLQADVLARWHRLIGDEVFYLTGTDENTLKLVKLAEKEGITPQELADKYAARFKQLTGAYDLSNDDFIRTTDETRHHPGATKVWEALAARELIYKGQYEGEYCVDCEQFYTDKEIGDGKCPVHGRPLEHRSEENYLFKLSAFTEQILHLVESGEYEILPASRRHEIVEVLKDGLHDISFSRPAASLKMGVPVPGDDSQRMYVWCDALTNYLTGVGYGRDAASFRKWWPADLHMIGKDIIRFHAAIWPAMLLGAGIPLPKRLYVHGFITADGMKMSKSLGNVVDPFAVVEQYGVAAARYYLLTTLPYAGDGDYAEQRFREVYNAHLANDLGNVASRVLAMVEKTYDGQVPAGTADVELKEHVGQTHHELRNLLDDCRFAEALELLNRLVSAANRYVDMRQPYKQTGQDKADTLYTLVQVLGHLALLYAPFMPEIATTFQARLGVTAEGLDWQSLLTWEKVAVGQMVTKGEALFPKQA